MKLVKVIFILCLFTTTTFAQEAKPIGKPKQFLTQHEGTL